ncbi:MAG: hypothetical protein IPF99_04360 [Deltaproteobacteria bacterium]|nr:hypothetical protein [Deltaproteobacteria bacterium]
MVALTQPQELPPDVVASAADSTRVHPPARTAVLYNDDTYQLSTPARRGQLPPRGLYRSGRHLPRTESRPYQLTVTVDPSAAPVARGARPVPSSGTV